jgi:glycosyltransferase involved in cell wall biosynthesis
MSSITVFDVITTAQGGKRLLEHRVQVINQDPMFINYLICPQNHIFTSEFYAKNIPYFPFSMTRGLNPIFTIKEIIVFYLLLKKYKPDIVHAHTSKAGAVSRIACRIYNVFHKKKIYICYQVHSFYFNTVHGLKSSLFLIIERFLSKYTDSLLFQNNTELQQAHKNRMDKHALLINIGNGINLSNFPIPHSPKYLPAWKTDKNQPVLIICIARIEPKKNHKMIVDTVHYLKQILIQQYGEVIANNAFKVICVGEIGETDAITYSETLNLQNYIHFVGLKNREEIIHLLQECHISILTSTAEGKPRALIESMCMGLPCVATNVVGTDEVIVHNETGYLIPLHDYKAFAEALKSLMENPELYTTFSRASITRARKEFDETIVIDKLKNIYRYKPTKDNPNLNF